MNEIDIHIGWLKRNTTPFRAEKYDGRENKTLLRKATSLGKNTLWKTRASAYCTTPEENPQQQWRARGAVMILKPEWLVANVLTVNSHSEMQNKSTYSQGLHLSRNMFYALKKIAMHSKKIFSDNSCTTEGTVISINPLILHGKTWDVQFHPIL